MPIFCVSNGITLQLLNTNKSCTSREQINCILFFLENVLTWQLSNFYFYIAWKFPILFSSSSMGFSWVRIFKFTKHGRFKLSAKELLPALWTLISMKGNLQNSWFSVLSFKRTWSRSQYSSGGGGNCNNKKKQWNKTIKKKWNKTNDGHR